MPTPAHDVRLFRVLRRFVALALALGGSGWAAELTIKNLRVPEFDTAGRMIRRPNAEITLSSPVYVWVKGEKILTEGSEFKLYVGKINKAGAAPAGVIPKFP